jgi:hypothetical protein
LHLFFACKFFVSEFFAFFSTALKSAKNSAYPYSNFVKKKFLGHISTFFLTLKPNSQETAQNFVKGVLQKFFRITFYTYIPVNPYHFLKRHHNRCTLLTTQVEYLVLTSSWCLSVERGGCAMTEVWDLEEPHNKHRHIIRLAFDRSVALP